MVLRPRRGHDPVTGRCRQRWRGGFTTKPDAEHALARQITGTDGRGAGRGQHGARRRISRSLVRGCPPCVPPVDGQELRRDHPLVPPTSTRRNPAHASSIRTRSSTLYADLLPRVRSGQAAHSRPQLSQRCIASCARPATTRRCRLAHTQPARRRAPSAAGSRPRSRPGARARRRRSSPRPGLTVCSRSGRSSSRQGCVAATSPVCSGTTSTSTRSVPAVRRSRTSVAYRVHEGEPKSGPDGARSVSFRRRQRHAWTAPRQGARLRRGPIQRRQGGSRATPGQRTLGEVIERATMVRDATFLGTRAWFRVRVRTPEDGPCEALRLPATGHDRRVTKFTLVALPMLDHRSNGTE